VKFSRYSLLYGRFSPNLFTVFYIHIHRFPLRRILLSFAFSLQHPVWTQQCCVIVELGNCKPLCTDFLNFLIEKIQVMFINLKPKPALGSNAESKDPLDHKPGDIEKSFYIFYMTEKLLKKWKKFHSSETSMNKSDSSQGSGTNILHLWRQNWSKSGNDSRSSEWLDNTECNPALRWKDVLEKLVMNTTEDYPFITLYSFKCLKLLQSGS